MTIGSNPTKSAHPFVPVVVSLLAVHVVFWLFPGVLLQWNDRIADLLFEFRSCFRNFEPFYDDTVVHVDINDSTIQKVGSFYLKRSQYALAVRNLNEMGVALQAYDIIFASRMNAEEDQALIDAVAESGNVYFGLAFGISGSGSQRVKGVNNDQDKLRYLAQTAWHPVVEGLSDSIPTGVRPLMTFLPLASVSRGLGVINVQADADGIFRKIPLLIKFKDGFYPSLALLMACHYLKVPPENVVLRPGTSITLKDALFPGKPPRDIVILINEKGELRVNFIGTWERMRHYDFARILAASEDPEEMVLWKEEMQGKLVVVSDVSTASADVGPVPTDVNFPLSGLHAMALHTILTEGFIGEMSPPASGMVMVLLGTLTILIERRSKTPMFLLNMGILTAFSVCIMGVAFIYQRILLDAVRPLAFIVLSVTGVTGQRYFIGAKEKEVLRRTLESYFPLSVVKKVLADPKLLALGGQRKELTILFSDIKDFTKYSASLPPHRLQELLNEYFETMVGIVFSYQGTVDKYIGDGLMVFFGDPEPQEDHALRCVRAAQEMQMKAAALREKWSGGGGFPLHVRIGINTGEVVVGNMGSSRRLAYTVIGSAVNMAQRLEANAPVDGILISRRTYELVSSSVACRSSGLITVKGMEKPLDVYEVITCESVPA